MRSENSNCETVATIKWNIILLKGLTSRGERAGHEEMESRLGGMRLRKGSDGCIEVELRQVGQIAPPTPHKFNYLDEYRQWDGRCRDKEILLFNEFLSITPCLGGNNHKVSQKAIKEETSKRPIERETGNTT